MDFIQSNLLLLSIVALIIVLALTVYSVFLLLKLKQQRDHIKSVQDERLSNIWLSIKTICDATLQQQCSISEATVRVIGLIDASALLNEKLQGQLTTTTEFYKAIEHHPILQNRKNTPANVIEKLDAEREELEAKYEGKILKELEWLRNQNLTD